MAPTAAFAAGEASSPIGATFQPPGYAKDRVVVRLVEGAGAHVLGQGRRAVGGGWFTVPTPPGVDPIEFAVELSAHPDVESVVPDLAYELMATPPFTPDDPWYVNGAGSPSNQWHLHLIDLPSAWQTTVGAGVRVAVLDTGVTDVGPDGFCGALIDEFNAVTLASGPGAAADSHGHGTHVAGSVAQCSGNGVFGASVAPGAKILGVDVFSGDKAFSTHIAIGIDWAIEKDAKVINLSLGLPGSGDQVLTAAIDRALAANIVVVAASGNEEDLPVHFPASHPGVIAVGASTISNGVAPYTSRGVGLEVVAPGGTNTAPVVQQSRTGTKQGSFGTSMATPHVSGIAALLRARYPQASATQVRNAIACTTLDLGPVGWDGDSGYGLVQAGAAVSRLGQMVANGAVSCNSLVSGASKVGAVETATGIWNLYNGSTKIASFYYGNPMDLPFFGDWDCDGVATPGLYRQSDGYVYLRNSNTQGVANISFFFGNAGDIPLAGDFNGDGCDTVSIYRPSEARFYIVNKLGSADKGLGVADYSYLFGNVGDVPFVGDWNGNGIDTPGLRRPSDGFVYLRNTNTQGNADISFFYGNTGDVVFAGDWNANGRDSIGLYRPSNGTIYLRNNLSTGVADITFVVGGGMQPAAGDF